jgi:transcriptional regulator with XRE-family HTH domain
MIPSQYQDDLNQIRSDVASRVRTLRVERRFTQKELAVRLGLSQSRLSEIERGEGSFTAEQLLVLLGLFNVPASHFLPSAHDPVAQLQNALVRLGATHLHKVDGVPPNERLEDVRDVVRETLFTDEPRLLTALAPVLNRHIARVNLWKLRADLVQAGLERRLGWLVENTVEAVRLALQGPSPHGGYQRLAVVLATFLDSTAPAAPVPDLLDAIIRSTQTRDEVLAASSTISKRWGIVTDLQPQDFVDALRAADDL